jgi:6-phosphofructokinase 2
MSKPIVTLTLNSCLDQVSKVDRVEPDRKLRGSSPEYHPGGGGLNVARAVGNLGGQARAVYTSGGHTGKLLDDLLEQKQIERETVRIEGMTRINLNVAETGSDRMFRFIMPGPSLSEDEVNAAIDRTVEVMADSDYLVVSGSVPEGVSEAVYGRLAEKLTNTDSRLLLDTSGESLRQALDFGVYLIKPNLRELSDLVGKQLDSDPAIVEAAQDVINRSSVQAIVVSLGGGGAYLVTRDEAVKYASPTVTIRSRVGAGDSLVAGLAVALSRADDLADAVQYGIAAGAAAVQNPGTELCHREDTDRLFDQTTREG